MDGIKRPISKKKTAEQPSLSQAQENIEQNFDRQAFNEAAPKKTKGKKTKIFVTIFVGILVLVVGFLAVVFVRYRQDITFSKSGKTVNFVVESGDTISAVAEELKKNDLIPSKISFEIYARLNNKTNLQAGRYSLSSAMTIPEILKYLNEGQVVESVSIMFVPGGTAAMAKKSLMSAGYSKKEIDAAFFKDYSAEFPKLFADKPAEADLEGFFYGETHVFDKGTSVEAILRRFLKDFEDKVVELDLASKFKAQGLNLYEGITLASIVQKETLSDYEDKRMVAGVFYNRMRAGMNLGSDVTYQYIADKLGVARDYNMKNPYNLRIYTGLTPTPISTPSVDSLKAVADPANHDYLYFLSGDDDKTYFGKTEAEHQKNITNHCQQKCQII